MPSLMIHVAIGNEINKQIHKDRRKLLLGTIAPDISQTIGEPKIKSHFITQEKSDIPDINKFLNIYKNNLNDDFVLGYYIHLYADYLWFMYFVPEIYNKEKHTVTKLDGTVINCAEDTAITYIYNDYNNLDRQLVDEYRIDLQFLSEESPPIDNIIKEIDLDNLTIVKKKVKDIYDNNINWQNMIFDMSNINSFISLSVKLIINNLKEIKNEE